jgi:hypothetical protein
VKDLTTELGYLGGYSIYSGVAHAELAGVWRLFGETVTTVRDRQPIHSPVPNPEASHAATDGVLKALMGPRRGPPSSSGGRHRVARTSTARPSTA